MTTAIGKDGRNRQTVYVCDAYLLHWEEASSQGFIV